MVRWTRVSCVKYDKHGKCEKYANYDPVRIASSKRTYDRTDLFTMHEIDFKDTYPASAVSTSNKPLSGKCTTLWGCTYLIPAELPLKTSGVTYYELNSKKNGFNNATTTKIPYDVTDSDHQIDTVSITYYRESDDSSIAGDYKVIFRYTPNAEKEFTAIDEYKI
jgi:hypothetical protein